MSTTRVFGSGGRESQEFGWAAFPDVDGAANQGARLAVARQDGPVSFLLVEVAPGGWLALHQQPERSICYVVSGQGTVQIPGQEDTPYQRGDVICFGGGVRHGWRGGGTEPTVLAVTVYP